MISLDINPYHEFTMSLNWAKVLEWRSESSEIFVLSMRLFFFG